jgi:hypothetical protein
MEDEPNDSNTPVPVTPVPDLIEQYRMRRDAWIAQADELARLRDEVRGSAEREAMEIVTAARRDVRQIVMEARRELLVLSAQVQAALGEAASRPDPAALLDRGRDTDLSLSEPPRELPEAIFAHEEAVKTMLDEARADIDALVEDARTVPFQALNEAPVSLPPSPALPAPPVIEPVSDAFAPTRPVLTSQFASRVFLSTPFPNDAVPVPSGRRLRTFVTLFGVAGAAVLVLTVWWLRTPNAAASPDTTARAETTPAPAAAPAASTATATPAPAPTTPTTEESSAELSVVIEARRAAWVRTTIDGETDNGRTLAQGESFKVDAERAVSIRAGDAGAVYVSVNRGEAMPLGRDGQVITRQFVAPRTQRAASALPSASQPLLAPAPPKPTAAATATTPTPPPPTPSPILQPVAAAARPAPVNPPPTFDPPAANVAREVVTPPASRAELPAPGQASPASAVIAASRQWLDAYQKQDRAAMASLSTDGLQLDDQRRNEERFPANTDVSRSLDRVSVQIAADTAVLTAVMTERSSDNSAPPRVSPISQVWVLNGNQWRVRQVRLVSEARLNQIFR